MGITKILGCPIDVGTESLISTEEDTIVYEWCCDCSLRHIVVYDPVEVEGKLKLRRRHWRDELATKLRRHHDKSQAKRNLRRRKK